MTGSLALAFLYWARGGLAWPVVAHALIDLRARRVRAPTHALQRGDP